MAEYIDREDVYNTMKAMYCDECTDEKCQMCEYAEIIFVLDNLPIADVQPVKHGRWESSQRTIETGTVYCSNCAIEYYISDLQTVGDCNGIVHYCPNCGAKMDAEPDEPWQSE